MMSRSQFMLLKLAEECAEVAQRASKQMQFGKHEVQKGQTLTNSWRLRAEVNDLLGVIYLLEESGELPRLDDPEEIMQNRSDKSDKIRKYLELSQSLGLVDR